MNRRQALKGLGAALSVLGTLPASVRAGGRINPDVLYGQHGLAPGICSRGVDTHTGVTQHVLEAGFAPAGRPCVVLLHGVPELA